MMTKTPKRRGRPRKPVQLFTHDGQTHTFAEWEEIRGLPGGSIQARLKAGASLEDAVLRLPQRNAPAAIQADDNRPASSPQQPGGWKPDLVRHRGQWVSIKEWRTRTGLTSDQLSERVHVLDWDFHRAVHEPKE